MHCSALVRLTAIILALFAAGCSDDTPRRDSGDGPFEVGTHETAPPDEGLIVDMDGPRPDGVQADGTQPNPDGAKPKPDATQPKPDTTAPKPDSAPGVGLAAKYPGDKGIDKDPQVVWVENFEEGSVGAVAARYESVKNQAGMSLVSGVPAKSSGKAAIKLVAGGSQSATDFYRRLLPGHDQLYTRYYVKYVGGVSYHHTGVWIGGYNPSTAWPSPKAGLKPSGNDRFSVAIEPMGSGPTPRLDFYNYWMKMHSWMTNPSGSTAYYGNTLVHQSSFKAANSAWICIEIKIKINPAASSGAGAELAVWKNDVLVQHFTDKSPVGYWIKDKFCPQGADGTECTNYPPPTGTKLIPLDLQFRNTTALKLNYFWPQNYITSGAPGAVYYDDMVVAKVRVGCLK
jgi:hypothetical protein